MEQCGERLGLQVKLLLQRLDLAGLEQTQIRSLSREMRATPCVAVQ
jgi:hypothetical protein